MHKTTLAVLMMAVVTISTSLTLAGQPGPNDSARASIAPPARPTALTPAQFQALQAAESTAENSKVLKSSATYAPPEKGVRWTRVSDDVWTVIYDVGWPGTYLGVLICAL